MATPRDRKRQVEAITDVMVNGTDVKTAMLKAKYKPGSAHNPHRLKKTKAWAELEKIYLSDELVIQKHHKGLNSRNERIMMDAVDKAYKVKGRYKSEAETADATQKLVALNQSIITAITKQRNAGKSKGSAD